MSNNISHRPAISAQACALNLAIQCCFAMSKATQTELRLARRMTRLGTETAFEVLVRARALEAKGKNIVHLEIGEPDFDTPANIIDAGVEALRGGWTHYGPSAGLPALREAIAEDAGRRRGVKIDPGEVVVVPGGKPIIFFTMLAFIEEEDEVIYPDPGFPIYESMIHFLGARAIPIRLREEMDFRLDVKELAGLINDRTKLIILNSPHNPTGGVLSERDVREIARVIGGRDLMVAGLNKISGFSCRVPHGAFYVFPNITRTGWTSKKLADALLEEAGVACLAGTAFGAFGEGYLRFSVANSVENISLALERITDWAGKHF